MSFGINVGVGVVSGEQAMIITLPLGVQFSFYELSIPKFAMLTKGYFEPPPPPKNLLTYTNFNCKIILIIIA